MNYIYDMVQELIEKYSTRDPYELCDTLGIMYRIADLGSLKGFFTLVAGEPVIIISKDIDEHQQREVCAHELGHALLHMDIAKEEFMERMTESTKATTNNASDANDSTTAEMLNNNAGNAPEATQDSDDNQGNLIMDATVAPANIKYPTDIDLLNKSREHLEKAISLLWNEVPHKGHMLPYNKKSARRSFLNLSKSKKWTKKKVLKAISEQLRYIELASKRLDELKIQVAYHDKLFPTWLKNRLEVIPDVYAQQKEMFESGKNSCENRIVSLEQPHVRPIVRGKRPNPTEFGQKTHLSVVNGYVYLEQTSWSNFNESTDLIPCAEDYKRKFGFYPKAILADKIYQTKANKKYCKERGIRLSGRSLGRKNQEQKEAETEQMYRDSCQRNWVEGKNGLLKTRYGMSRVMCKLDESAKSDLVFAILAMNAFRKLREDILRLFREIGFSLVVCCVILCCETA